MMSIANAKIMSSCSSSRNPYPHWLCLPFCDFEKLAPTLDVSYFLLGAFLPNVLLSLILKYLE